ncbi:MAG: YceI family protein [Flavobacterium sp.]
MKKILILGISLFVSNCIFAQKAITKTGEIKFEASVPAFEEVAATNKLVSCILDQSNGQIAALVLIKSFKFKSPLMEEHFNENYMESSEFPKATFKGTILKFNAAKLSSAKEVYDLEGSLTIHGVTKRIKTKITLNISGKNINAVSNLVLKPQDYGIEIPAIVKNKIAEKVDVSVNFVLEQKG